MPILKEIKLGASSLQRSFNSLFLTGRTEISRPKILSGQEIFDNAWIAVGTHLKNAFNEFESTHPLPKDSDNETR